jgi:hypothetical protein
VECSLVLVRILSEEFQGKSENIPLPKQVYIVLNQEVIFQMLQAANGAVPISLAARA